MQLIQNRAFRAVSVAMAGLVLGSCGGNANKSDSSAPTTPVTVPSAAPAATTPQPISASCDRLPLGAATYRCRDDSPTFLGEVSDAIRELKSQHPEYFDRGDIVNNVGGYYVGVIRNLDKQGICAGFDGEELTVKNSAEFNDQYKILTSWNQVREYYIGTCYPAVFPLSRSAPAPSPDGCSLPPSAEVACGTPDSQFVGEVLSAIDQVTVQKPELFDFGSTSNGWPLVKDMPSYHAAVIQALTQKGYCGKFDGEEIAVKRTNDFTEHFDINYADKYIRKGPGIYRGSCYPAAF
jgi:hypothetical protein